MNLKSDYSQSKIRRCYFLAIIFILSGLNSSPAFSKNKFTVSTGGTFITGDYGQTEATEMFYVPFTLKYKYKKFTLKTTIPYLHKTGPRPVIRDVGSVNSGPRRITKTESGLGNINASLSYRFFYSPKFNFMSDIRAKVFIGNASQSKGLGTGKTDYSFRLSVYKFINDFTPFARVGYKVYSHPRLNDVFFTHLGFSYKLTDWLSGGLNYAWREKVSNKGEDKNQITVFSTQKLDQHWKIQEHIIKGFGRSTADWGAGFSVSYSY